MALRRVLDHGTKMVYVASLNDQIVPVRRSLGEEYCLLLICHMA